MSHPSHPLASTSDPIAAFLANTALAPRQAYKALTVWPLVHRPGAPAPAGPAYEPIAAALARGDVRVDEVGDGTVPHVRVTNGSEKAVLFLFGEEIVGAMQNRVANATFLVPAKSEVVIDVSCVEAGRWGRRGSAGFASVEQVLSSDLRRKMASKVRIGRAAGGGFRADQAEVWDEVAGRLHIGQTLSSTDAWSDYRASRANDLAECERAFEPLPEQVGFVAAIGDEVAGLEAIASPEVFATSFSAMLRSYAIDALDAGFLATSASRKDARAPRFDAPEAFLEALGRATSSSNPSLGLGSDLRLTGEGIEGCALACEGLVHLTAFPAAR